MADGAMPAAQALAYDLWSSSVDPGFWSQLRSLKLESLKLSEDPISVEGTASPSSHDGVNAPLSVPQSALGGWVAVSQPAWRHPVPGEVVPLNTVESLRTYDRAELEKRLTGAIWEAVRSGEALRFPGALLRFAALSYVDMKTFRFYYWFTFPALVPQAPFRAPPPVALAAWRPVADDAACGAAAIAAACQTFAKEHPDQPAWIVRTGTGNTAPAAHPLAELESGLTPGDILAFSDPSSHPTAPGWPLLNLLVCVAAVLGDRAPPAIDVLSVRLRRGVASAEASRVFQVDVRSGQVPPASTQTWSGKHVAAWEAGLKDKRRPGPRVVDLSQTMDPRALMDSAVKLNISLMKWRAVPELDTEALANARCVLFGAGTLGCAVARCLLGWGVRHITLVDSGRVSFSNPARQSLFTFEDCLEGGKPKAKAAAAALRAILPSVTAEGHSLLIPMPGHPPGSPEDEATLREAWRTVDDLVASHDVTFLLTDTRESRWLPTIAAAAHNKVAINAALGFDSYLVMRHGGQPGEAASSPRLGCYFCNDVVAPVDSTRDRAMDQQCTVARPGLAPVAGALAVEVMAACLTHRDAPHPAAARASDAAAGDGDAAPLGTPPHMIRGSFADTAQSAMTGTAYSCCTACSEAVVSRYRARGWDFVAEALSHPGKLEEVSGLADLKAGADACLLGGEESDGGSAGPSGARESADEWEAL
ncbi:unnamed protein product [Pedinophyceae sp. YPF-701]|nr:unnamed protein product [Pedinophyceae sp. YPF-701]